MLGTVNFSIYYLYEITSYFSNTSIYHQCGDSFSCCSDALAHLFAPRFDRFVFDFVLLCTPSLTVCCETP